MQLSVDKKKYIANYSVSVLEFATRFLWMFLAIPKITGTLPVQVYGVYMAVVSFGMFLSYADLGFLSAAHKFGCDEYLKGNKNREVEILASASFVQFLAFIVFAIVMGVFAVRPSLVINGLNEETEYIGRWIFILFALFSFVSIPRQIISYIAQFRIELYRVKIWEMCANLVNIILVYVILTSEKGINVVYYYFFNNVVIILVTIGVGIVLFRKWEYSVLEFFSHFKFNRSVLQLLWPFAKASFVSSLLYILYSELDKIYVAKFLSAEQLAYYVIGLNLMTFIRSLGATLNSPYVPKYNKYYVENNNAGMKEFYHSHLSVVSPFITIPVTVGVILMPQIILSWVGQKFTPSILIAQILVGSFFIAPFVDIASYIITAKLKISAIYISSVVATFVFWGLTLSLSGSFNVVGVAVAKLVSAVIAGLFYIIVAHKLIQESFLEYFKKILIPCFGASLVAGGVSLCFKEIAVTKGKVDFLEILALCGIISLVSFVLYVFLSKQFRVAIGNPTARNFWKFSRI